MTNSVVLSEVDSDTMSVTAQSVQSDVGGLTAKLKGDGVVVLLHTGVGRIEPGSLRLHERSGKLVVKPKRPQLFGMFPCCCYRHEFGPGELEPVPRRVYTRRLHRSIGLISGGDPHMKEDLLSRSLSLIRRYPTPDCVDLTFETMEEEERLRKWAHDRLTVPDSNGTFRGSSRHVVTALQGKCPSDTEYDPSNSPTARVDPEDDDDEDEEDNPLRGLLSSAPMPGKKVHSRSPAAMRRKTQPPPADPTASEGADDEGSDAVAEARSSDRAGKVLTGGVPSGNQIDEPGSESPVHGRPLSSKHPLSPALEDGPNSAVMPVAEKPRRRRSRRQA